MDGINNSKVAPPHVEFISQGCTYNNRPVQVGLSPLAKVAIAVAFGLMIAAGGLLGYVLFPRILEKQIESRLVLCPENEVYEHWEKTPVPVYIKFYFFNYKNPVETFEELPDSKPIVEEMGPYTFRETREKVNITFHENGTVSYRQVKRYYFQPDLTEGSLDDVITTVNVPVVSAAYKMSLIPEVFFHFTISQVFEQMNYTFYIQKTVRELLFEGYEEELFTIAKSLDMEVPYDKFGWLYQKNNSDDMEYTIFSGAQGMQNYGFVNRWNGESQSEAFNDTCGMINGTSGEMWPPYSVVRDSKPTFFVRDICRSISLSYLKDVSVQGINAYRFWADNKLFDYSVDENQCFCTDGCFPNGVLNISACQHGAPVVMSYPHFLYGDTSFQMFVEGLKPDPIRHQFFMDIEPQMGIPINVEARFQINVWVDPMEGILQFENFSETRFFPIFWFEQFATVHEDMASKLRLVTEDLPHYVTIGSFVLVLIGGVILLFTLLYAIRYTKKRREHKMMYRAVKLIK